MRLAMYFVRSFFEPQSLLAEWAQYFKALVLKSPEQHGWQDLSLEYSGTVYRLSSVLGSSRRSQVYGTHPGGYCRKVVCKRLFPGKIIILVYVYLNRYRSVFALRRET